ncbi:DUF3006 family protein [Aquibacillus halophilus]|uniref:DUF3006 family protein n=1 Tax=Aquibacillus halophilus TaxID=930132 RepID=A0A6A8D6S6_9BACI|nr:DUF3006 family protein [Aquibacillus halophilus]
MKGYLDRIEEGKFAVILVDEINKEFILPKAELPVGSSEQSYFDLTIENDKITSLKLNEQTTSTEQEKVDNLISKIRSKNKDSKFKKK